jgi:CDP-diacylglycerol--glycerol-3-phosphate 3-phosphatidyltransferase
VGQPRARGASLTRELWERRWSALHHGIEPQRVPLLLPWLRGAWRIAGVLRVVPPNVITAAGVLLALDAVLLARELPWVTAGVVVLAVLADALDGAVAVVADRVTRSGEVLDALADRVADACLAAVLWRCGAPWGLALGCAATAILVDGLRRVTRRAAVITVAERPTFTICTLLACGSAGVGARGWPVLVCALVWLGATAVALVQLGFSTAGDPSTAAGHAGGPAASRE